jgi:hypothetical protein
MTDPIRNLRNDSPSEPARRVLPPPPTFEFVLAKPGTPTIATVVAALTAEFGGSAKAARLSTTVVGEYADVYKVDINGNPAVIKLAAPSGEMSLDTAVELLNQDKIALAARLPGLPTYLGALRDRDGFIVAVIAEFIPGTELPTALKSDVISATEAEDKVVGILKGFFAQKFNLIDPNPENFLITRDRQVVLINGGALSRREMLIERFNDVEAAEIQLIHSAFFEKRGETVRKLNLREIAGVVVGNRAKPT